MSTMPTNGDQRWRELVRVIGTLSAQVQHLTETGGHEMRHQLEQATRHIQEAVANLAQRQGTGALGGSERYESSSVVGKNVVPEGVAKKASFKQWSRRYVLVAGGKDVRLKVFLEWAGGHEESAPTGMH